jgi:hypothetical protein
MGVKLGLEAKLYYDPLGAEQSAWNEIGNAKDVTLNLEKGEADVTTRANQGWRATVGTLKEGSVEWEMIWDTADPAFTAVKDSWFNNTLIGLAVMDGDIGTVGNQGLWADFSIINFTRNEPLEEAITVNVTAKPTYSTYAPNWVTIGA